MYMHAAIIIILCMCAVTHAMCLIVLHCVYYGIALPYIVTTTPSNNIIMDPEVCMPLRMHSGQLKMLIIIVIHLETTHAINCDVTCTT